MILKKAWLILPLIIMNACTPVLSSTTSNLDTDILEAPIEIEEVIPEVEEEEQVNPYSLEALAGRTYGEGGTACGVSLAGKRRIYAILHHV